MLNTFLFRDTYKKVLTGNVNYLALKMSKIKDKTKDLDHSFTWRTYGGRKFWADVFARNTISPEKWEEQEKWNA